MLVIASVGLVLAAAEASSYFFSFTSPIYTKFVSVPFEEYLTESQIFFLRDSLQKERLLPELSHLQRLDKRASILGIDYSLRMGDQVPTPDDYRSIVRTKVEGEVLYDVWINRDHFGRRLVAGALQQAEQEAVFLGDSFLFGEGLPNEHTIPSWFQRLNPRLKVINAGLPGAGPNDFLFRLDRDQTGDPFLADIDTKSGVVYYIFREFQVQRVTCALSGYYQKLEFQLQKPFYSLSENELTYLGNCRTPIIRDFVLNAISKSNFVSANHLDWPLPSSAYTKELVAKILSEIKERALRRFNAKRFVVVIFPSNGATLSIVPYLRKTNLEVMNFGEFPLEKLLEGKHQIPGDKHPSAASAFVVAHLIHWHGANLLKQPLSPMNLLTK